MVDPAASTAAGLAGIKYGSLLAGFAGGVVSLSYMRELTAWQMALAVLAGTLTAGYLTPLAMFWLGGVPIEAENAIAFLVGLTAMNIIPGFIRLSAAFRNRPGVFFNTGGNGK